MADSVTAKGTFKVDKITSDNATGYGASVKLRKQVNDIKFTLSLSEASFTGYADLKDVVLTADKDLGSGLKTSLEYEAGKRSTKATVTWDNDKRDVRLKGVWVEKGNTFKGEADVVLDAENSVGATYDFSSQKATAKYTHRRGASSLATKYNFDAEAWTLTANTKKGKDAYKAEWNTGNKGVTLEWGRNQYKLVGKGRVTGNGVQDMSVAATYEYVIDL